MRSRLAVAKACVQKESRGVSESLFFNHARYDALSRPILKTYSDGTPPVSCSYDAAPGGMGRLSLASEFGLTLATVFGPPIRRMRQGRWDLRTSCPSMP